MGALFIDLLKAFNTLDHSPLLAKFGVYGFDSNSLSFPQSYWALRFQRSKIESVISGWLEITTAVPQGSILGPI